MKPFIAFLALFLGCCAGVMNAQGSGEQPVCSPERLPKTITGTPSKLVFKQRLCLYGSQLVTVPAVLGSGFFAGIAQLRDDPTEWGQGTEGYARRFGARYGQGVAKSTGEFVFSSILREDPRYELSPDPTFWKRTGHAFASTFVMKNLEGKRHPAYSKFAGAASSGVVGLAWYPDRLNRPVDVLARTGSAFGGYLASSIFQEFKPDLLHLVSTIFKRGGNKSGNSQGSEVTR